MTWAVSVPANAVSMHLQCHGALPAPSIYLYNVEKTYVEEDYYLKLLGIKSVLESYSNWTIRPMAGDKNAIFSVLAESDGLWSDKPFVMVDLSEGLTGNVHSKLKIYLPYISFLQVWNLCENGLGREDLFYKLDCEVFDMLEDDYDVTVEHIRDEGRALISGEGAFTITTWNEQVTFPDYRPE